MADKVAEQNEVEIPKAEKEVKQAEPAKEEEEEKSENGKTEATNGDADEKENGPEVDAADDQTDAKICSTKRKSAAGGDAAEDTPAEGATPEKKAKLDEATAEAESNGKTEVAA